VAWGLRSLALGALLGGLAAAPAMAAPARYWFIGASVGGRVIEYIDAASVAGEGASNRSATLQAVHEGPATSAAGAAKYDEKTVLYDCAARTYAVKSVNTYSKDGKRLGATSSPTLAWRPTKSDALAGAEAAFVCGDAAARLKRFSSIQGDPVANADALYAVVSTH